MRVPSQRAMKGSASHRRPEPVRVMTASGPAHRRPHDTAVRRPRVNVLETFRKDHENIQGEFEGFQTAGGDDRYFLANRLIRELEIHTRLEAEVLYPALRDQAERCGDRKGAAVMRAAWKTSQAVQQHLAEVKDSLAHDEAFLSQIDALMQRVQEYARWEEGEVFPLAHTLLGEAGLMRLRGDLHARRQELGCHRAA